MSQVGRLAGAILAKSGDSFFLVGNPKEPCDFEKAGFEPPGEIDAVVRPYIRLTPCCEVPIEPPCFSIEVEGEELAGLIAKRFLIGRNGSVSERLWRLVAHPEGQGDSSGLEEMNGRWLAEMPDAVWGAVREAVLKCL